jgi:hypothetical protein
MIDSAWDCLAGEAPCTCQHGEVRVSGELGGILVACCEACRHKWTIVDRPLRNGQSALASAERGMASRARQ